MSFITIFGTLLFPMDETLFATVLHNFQQVLLTFYPALFLPSPFVPLLLLSFFLPISSSFHLSHLFPFLDSGDIKLVIFEN